VNRPPLLLLGSSGVALVVTLMMMSVLVMMVVGLAGVMRNEQAAARNLTYQVLAEQLAEVGVRQGMTAVLTNTPAAGQITATGPGWMLAGNTTRYLVSPAGSVGQIKNLEEIGTNSLILGLRDGSRGGVYAGWTNLSLPGQPTNRPIGRYAWWVDDEGTKLNLNAVGPNNTNLFLPYLTKYLSRNTDPTIVPTFPFSADWVFADLATGATNSTNAAQALALRSRVLPLPTPESMKDTNILPLTSANQIGTKVYRRRKGNVTTWSSNADLTPWGAPKVNLNDPGVSALTISTNLTNAGWSSIFGNQTWATKFGGASSYVLGQFVANLQAARGTTNTNTSSGIGAGIFQHRTGLPADPVPTVPGTTHINEVAISVTSLRGPANNVLTAYLQIQVELVNPYASDDVSSYTLEVLPRKFRFRVACSANPPTGGASISPSYGSTVYTTADSTGIDGLITGVWMGPMPDNSNPRWPTNEFVTMAVPGLAAKTYQSVTMTPPIQLRITITAPAGNRPLQLAQAYVQLDWIRLRRGNQIVDWVSMDDFSQDQNFGANNTTRLPGDRGQMNFALNYPGAVPAGSVITLPVAENNQPAPAQAQGLAKSDPRVRFPAGVWNPAVLGSFRLGGLPAGLQAWRRVRGVAANQAGGSPVLTLGSHNLGIYDGSATGTNVTGFSYLLPDPAPGVLDITNHPHFTAGYSSTNGFTSIGQLGSLHLGLPWRTLRLQPTPAAELAQGPPDWILLDVFTATNPAVALPRVNLNGLITSLQASNNTNPGVPILGNQIQTRPWPLLGAMGTLRTNLFTTNTNAFISNGVPISLTNPATAIPTNTLMAFATNNVPRILSNPIAGGTNWAVNSGWGNQRVSLANRFPSNGLALTGELLEIRGVADDPTAGEDVIEGRLRGFLDMVTTRSDTFSVWSIGQGLVVVTNSSGNPIRTNVMGEVRKQTVFQREPIINGGAVSGYRLKTLYTRNHIVE
jgi:hypothetical protein